MGASNINIFHFLSLPIIGAVIGWITNWVAVRMLFRPYRPVKVLGFDFQGVIPKRRAELARSIGQVVEKELISIDDLLAAVKSKDMTEKISEALAVSIKSRIMDRMPVFVPLSVKRVISDIITDQVKKDIPSMVGESLGRFGHLAKENISFQAIVEERVNNFSLERLEEIVLSVSARELKHIEILGGVLGFIIGLFQAMILYFTVYAR